jgi:dihydropyrimidinase
VSTTDISVLQIDSRYSQAQISLANQRLISSSCPFHGKVAGVDAGLTAMEFDTIITHARLVTASEVYSHLCSIGITSGKISAIASTLQPSQSTEIIDAEGAYVTPGGIDSHVHLHQDNAPSGDKWLSGSRSALAGGNTTILAFATQEHKDESLFPVIEEYHSRARDQSYVDYGFHLILTKPTPHILNNELPKIASEGGITSVKLYMTYPGKRLHDGQMLDIMMSTRSLGMTTMIHAENADMIDLVTQRLLAHGKTTPYYHALARPAIAESEATHRAIALATLTSTPILLVHMSTPVALSHARKAQSKSLLPIHAETCPHYLYLTSQQLASTTNIHQDPETGHTHEEHDEWAGAKHICAPPLRHSDADLQAVWDALNNGTITVVSSDHAPTRYDDLVSGKQKAVEAARLKGDGSKPTFAATPNGLPGIETRLPVLFHAATSDKVPASRRISLEKFVAVTSTNAARLYGFGDRKGVLAPGYDADVVIWYPQGDSRGKTVIRNGMLHHAIDYTPFEGFEVDNWPRRVLLRGKVAWDRDAELRGGHGKGLLGGAGDGEWLCRGKGEVLVGRRSGGWEVEGMGPGEREAWGLGT